MKKIIIVMCVLFPLFGHAEGDRFPNIKDLINTIGTVNEIKIDMSNSPALKNEIKMSMYEYSPSSNINKFIKKSDSTKDLLILDMNNPKALDGIHINTKPHIVYYGYKEVIVIDVLMKLTSDITEGRGEYYKTIDTELKKLGFKNNNSFFDNIMNIIMNIIYRTKYNYNKDNINITVSNYDSIIRIKIYDKDFDNKLEKMQEEIRNIAKVKIEDKNKEIIKLFE